jgi:hypothetical protein
MTADLISIFCGTPMFFIKKLLSLSHFLILKTSTEDFSAAHRRDFTIDFFI